MKTSNRLACALSIIVLSPLGASAAITGIYVDATINNTTNAEGSAIWYSVSTSSSDGLWRHRTDYGEGGTVFEDDGAEDCPMLKTTLTGLAPGALYNIRAIYTIQAGGWRLWAGFDPDYWVYCGQDSGVYTETDYGTGLPQYECVLGVARADSTGNLEVLIDDAPGNRNWYDGLSYERTTRENAPFAYVNATVDNTTNHLGGAWVTTLYDTSDNLWQDRSNYSGGYNVFEAHKAEDAPLLRTTQGGLPADAMYDVYFYYGSHTSGVYRIQAGLSPDALTQYDINNGTATGYVYNDGLLQYRAALGRVTIPAEGEIAVYVDDLVGAPDRAWYDGIGLQMYVPFGTTILIR